MPFYKDYKQVLSLLMFIAGVVLIILKNESIGIPLLAAATGVTLGKFGGKSKALLLAALLLIPLSGCKTNMVSVEAIKPGLTQVLDRHDAYVKADAKLEDFLKKVYLRTSELIRMVLDDASK